MKIVVKKSEGESNERLLTRFNKIVKASKKIEYVKNNKFHVPAPKKRYIRAAAVMREFYRKKKEKSRFY